MTVDPPRADPELDTLIHILNGAAAMLSISRATVVAEQIRAAGFCKTPRLPTPEECDASDHGHEFYDICTFCDVEAHDWYHRNDPQPRVTLDGLTALARARGDDVTLNDLQVNAQLSRELGNDD